MQFGFEINLLLVIYIYIYYINYIIQIKEIIKESIGICIFFLGIQERLIFSNCLYNLLLGILQVLHFFSL